MNDEDGQKVERPRCDRTGKLIFGTKKAAKEYVRLAASNKSMRAYPCQYHKSHWHTTSWWKEERGREVAEREPRAKRGHQRGAAELEGNGRPLRTRLREPELHDGGAR